MIQVSDNWLLVGAVFLVIAAAVMFARGIWLKFKNRKHKIDPDAPPEVVSRYYPRSQWKHFDFVTQDRDIKVYKDGKEIKYVNYIEIDTEGMRIERYVYHRKTAELVK